MGKTINIKHTDGYLAGLGDNDHEFMPLVNKLKKWFGTVNVSDTPQYVFATGWDGLSDDYLLYPDAVRIFGTGENICPDFTVFDYAYGFEDLSFGDRYFRYPHCCAYEEDWALMEKKHLISDEEISNKSEFCSFVVSKNTGRADSMREDMFHALSRYKRVNSGGRYLNNIGMPQGVPDKLEFQKKHKFAICAENVSHRGYCTEKIVQAYAAGCIPIYWGDPMAKDIFNPDSFIDCTNMDSLDEMVVAVKKVDDDDELYINMLKTPALLDPDYKTKLDKGFDDFLYHIFEQDIEKAYRRDRVAYGKWTCDKMLEAKKVRESVMNNPEVILSNKIRSRINRIKDIKNKGNNCGM